VSELLRLQQDFAASLRDRSRTAGARRWLAGDAAHVEERVAIYRANMQAAAEKALAAAYPVVRQAVGEDFFRGLAREFQRGTPSTSGDLGDYGAAFDRFLAAFEHTQDMPWLPDLARLEWATHRAYGAADGRPWDPAALMQVDAEDQGSIRFDWSPGAAVVESAYPIVRVWTIHQAGHDGEFSVDWSVAECALVARDGFVVRVTALSPGEAAFMSRSLAGAPLGDAAAAALQADAGFDLGALLGRAIGANLVCGFALTSPELQQEPTQT
jgi:hypothetical protein